MAPNINEARPPKETLLLPPLEPFFGGTGNPLLAGGEGPVGDVPPIIGRFAAAIIHK